MFYLKDLVSALCCISIFISSSCLGFEFVPENRPNSHAPRHINHSKKNLNTILMKKFNEWEGVSYQLGGTGRDGIDCSAFVRLVMRDINIHLPRTTNGQLQNGEKVKRHLLRSGDLVFFRTAPGVKHVGIYLNEGRFMHSSTSKGVIISNLYSKYWSVRYDTAKRVVNDGN